MYSLKKQSQEVLGLSVLIYIYVAKVIDIILPHMENYLG